MLGQNPSFGGNAIKSRPASLNVLSFVFGLAAEALSAASKADWRRGTSTPFVAGLSGVFRVPLRRLNDRRLPSAFSNAAGSFVLSTAYSPAASSYSFLTT